MLRLAASTHRRAPLKLALLVLLVTIGGLVFLTVSELSRASSADLTDAIDSELGGTGTYQITVSPDLGLTPVEEAAAVRSSAAGAAPSVVEIVRSAAGVEVECPPAADVGEVGVAVVLDERGMGRSLAPGNLVPNLDEACLGGVPIAAEALRESTPGESSALGARVVLDPDHLPQLELSAPPGAMRTTVLLRTGDAEDQAQSLRTELTARLRDAASSAGVNPDEAVQVQRVDSADSVRAASDGVKLVYGLIGWGVLLVSGLGLLIAQLIVLRDRTWFYGLSRAVGARRLDIARLVLADIVVVLALGLGLVLVLALAAGPIVSDFGRSAFGTDLRLLRPETLPRLVLAFGLMALVGGLYPAWRSTRLDPVEVLERR